MLIKYLLETLAKYILVIVNSVDAHLLLGDPPWIE